jgi:tetrahydromethanopterin S-methyltransferase subunit G
VDEAAIDRRADELAKRMTDRIEDEVMQALERSFGRDARS